MPVNGVRVLPDIPKNMPNMESLTREFEIGSMLASRRNNTASKSSTLSDGNFVKKIVEAYESSVRTSNIDVVKNKKNVEKNGSSLAMYDPQCRNFKEKSKIFLTPFETRKVEDDFVILNRYHSESDVKTVSETWPVSPKINMYSSMDVLSTSVQSSPSWNLKKRKLENQLETRKKKLMICSSPLDENEDLDCENLLDDILTTSCDSSSNNSYRNLQADLYGFEEKQWLCTTSLSSLKSSLGSSHNNMLSINNDDGSLLLDSSFQDVTVTFSKDISKDRENLRDSKLVPSPSSNLNQNSSRVIGASLNEERPINNDACVTWISALGEKLSRKKSLKKLLKSAFNTKLSNYKIWKKSTEKQPNERVSDSGFVERFLPSSSSFAQKSCCSNEKPSAPLTFGTFGRAKNACANDKDWLKSSRMVLTEVPCEKFTSDSEPSDLTPWVPLRSTTIFCKENRGNVESSLKSTMLTSSLELKAPCGYPPLPKHPYLTRNGIPKHSFIAETNLDQTMEREISCGARERESDTRELEHSGTTPVSQAEPNYSKMFEWLGSSPNNCDLLRSRSCNSRSVLDELVPQQTPENNNNNVFTCNFNTDFLSTVHNNPYMQRESCTHRYATVSPKNLRFSMSREKSRAIEKSFDVYKGIDDSFPREVFSKGD